MANVLRKGIIPYGGSYKGDGTRVAEDALGFGVPVELGSDPDKQVKTYAGGTFWGISVRDETLTALDGSGNVVTYSYYPDEYPVSIIRQGYIVVEVAEAVKAGDPVYVDTSGKFYKSDDELDRTLISGLRYETSAGKDEQAILSANLPA